MTSSNIWTRHDGHQDKGEGYYTRNNGIVKLTFWGMALVVILFYTAERTL